MEYIRTTFSPPEASYHDYTFDSRPLPGLGIEQDYWPYYYEIRDPAREALAQWEWEPVKEEAGGSFSEEGEVCICLQFFRHLF